MKLLVGNFKMNLLKDEIDEYIKNVKNHLKENVIFCAPFIYLDKLIENGFKVGAQDVSEYDNGAYTGEISSTQLKSLGCMYSIVGHSERRMYFDDNKRVNEKIKKLLRDGLTPILCVGENKEEYENKETGNVIKRELQEAFKDVDPSNVIIAYEPIWAIGTGLVPINSEIESIAQLIKEFINEEYKTDIKVLYGGSVSTKNINELEKISNIDGYLVGGASIKVDEWNSLINIVK